MDKINLLSEWIKALLIKDHLPFHLFENHTIIEDGMNMYEYWMYEKKLFHDLAPLYDLDQHFSIKIISENRLDNHKLSVCFYLYNTYNKIVYKMTQTIIEKNSGYLLSGNNFLCQVVPKYIIINNEIQGCALAIQSPYVVKNIISPDIFLENLTLGANYEEDGFYSAQFSNEDICQNHWYSFYLVLSKNEQIIKEKRKIYFDNFLTELNPIQIDKNKIILLDQTYPVNLAAFSKIQGCENYSYPRNISLLTEKYTKIIATDCLDNDWIYNL